MFEGFSQEALDFLNDIRFNNNQTFYEANKARYERYVKQPMRELSDELAPVVQLIDPKLDTRPGRTMSRIRRDTRYTKDKSPFRDHAWLGWRYPGEGRGEGFHMYWGFGPDWLGWGCGCYYTDKPLMDALRLHIRRESDDVRRCLESAGRALWSHMAKITRSWPCRTMCRRTYGSCTSKNTSALSATARRQSGRCCTRAAWRT